MYDAEKYDCPCCRENMIAVMAYRIGEQPNWYEREIKETNPYYNFVKMYNNGRFSTFKIIKDLYEFILPSEEELRSYFDYNEDENTYEFEINEDMKDYFWDKKSAIHFNKIQRKVGYKPMDMAKMGGKFRTVME